MGETFICPPCDIDIRSANFVAPAASHVSTSVPLVTGGVCVSLRQRRAAHVPIQQPRSDMRECHPSSLVTNSHIYGER